MTQNAYMTCDAGFYHEVCPLCDRPRVDSEFPLPFGSRDSRFPLRLCNDCATRLYDLLDTPEKLRDLLEAAK